MKRFLAAILSLTLILSALCAVGVSAENTYPKDGNVTVFYDDFESYDTSAGSIKLPYNSWSGLQSDIFTYEICDEDGNKVLRTSNWKASVALGRYFDSLAWKEKNPDNSKSAKDYFAQSRAYVRFVKSKAFEASPKTDYYYTCDYVYKQGGTLQNTSGYLGIFSSDKPMWMTESSQKSSYETYPTSTTTKKDNGWYTAASTLNVYAFGAGKKDTSASISLCPQAGSWASPVYDMISNIMKKAEYSALTSSDTSSDTYKAAVAEIQTELDNKDYRVYLDNVKVVMNAKIYQDTVNISGGSADVRAKTDATGNGAALNNGDKIEVNNAFGTVYTITPANGVVGRVKYNGTPVYFEQNGNIATVTIPGASVTQNGTLEVVIAENSEYVTNTYTANFVGGTAVNGVANPSLTSTDGRVTLQGANAMTGNEANKADSAAGTFAYNSNASNHRMGVVFNKNAENPIYYACGRNYNWKLFHTGTYKPGYLQWSNPTSTDTCKSFKDNKQLSQRFINGTSNGPSGNGANTGNYVWNDNSNGADYIRFYATKGGDTTGNEYGYSIPGNIEILPGSKGVFNGFEYSETVMMHKISFDGEGTLNVKAASLNSFENNKCDKALTNGQSAKVEDLMKADFTVTAPENKVIEAIRYVTYDGETEVGTELIGKQSGSFSIQPVEASGTIKVIYKENTPVEPKVEYSGSNVEHNKEYTVNGETKISENSIIMYGTVAGEFDAYGFILSQFGADGVKTGEVTLAAVTKSADGKFAVRVVGDGITVGKYSTAPYSVISNATDKGTETDITVTEN